LLAVVLEEGHSLTLPTHKHRPLVRMTFAADQGSIGACVGEISDVLSRGNAVCVFWYVCLFVVM
jgi:hypothetical protein